MNKKKPNFKLIFLKLSLKFKIEVPKSFPLLVNFISKISTSVFHRSQR